MSSIKMTVMHVNKKISPHMSKNNMTSSHVNRKMTATLACTNTKLALRKSKNKRGKEKFHSLVLAI